MKSCIFSFSRGCTDLQGVDLQSRTAFSIECFMGLHYRTAFFPSGTVWDFSGH
jgi:hypothetical protein